MKINEGQLSTFNPAQNKTVRGCLIYGFDQGLVSESGAQIAKHFDAMSIADFAPEDFRRDPQRFLDEALSISLLGGRRLLKVTDAGDTFTKQAESFLESKSDAFLLVTTDSLAKNSSLRGLFENHKNLYCLACYADEGTGLQSLIKKRFSDAGIAVSGDALALLSSKLGADRLMTQSEIDKLILYLGDRKHLSPEDVSKVVDDASALSFDLLQTAVMEGKLEEVQPLLDDLYHEGETPVRIIRLFAMHFAKLSAALSETAAGKSVDMVVAGLRPPLYFKAVPSFKKQMRLWTLPAVSRAEERLIQAEIDCKTTGYNAETVCAHTLTLLTLYASKRK